MNAKLFQLKLLLNDELFYNFKLVANTVDLGFIQVRRSSFRELFEGGILIRKLSKKKSFCYVL
jgi:hypothetical protein